MICSDIVSSPIFVGAAPHPPAGTFSPYSDGEKGSAPALASPSPRSSRGEGKGEGQRRRR
ncbi:MAG: hypothetical protein EOQ29_27165 [Mesorhizobium sp.]|nr:MAG: hypothetical protein EOQ29_27165 [Mesorhizobium sp.]RWB11880.1 MAG: hypothetical protein EOQ40_33735 [Mesorhizobium sp.]TIS50073.1 MAG: hypothetical protein E5W96_12010 [Mesorhizobium sp.]